MTDLGHNPRYANYARAHGHTPEGQLEQDTKDLAGRQDGRLHDVERCAATRSEQRDPACFRPRLAHRPRRLRRLADGLGR